MSTRLDAIDLEITSLLEREGPLRTREIADRVGIPRPAAYRRCRKLQSGHHVSSERVPSEHPLYFFPVTGDVLTSANRQDLQAMIARLKRIGQSVEATRGAQLTETQKSKLLERYRREFARLEKTASPSERERIKAFERQLLHTLRGTTRGDVLGLFGLRGFFVQERRWTHGSGGGVDD